MYHSQSSQSFIFPSPSPKTYHSLQNSQFLSNFSQSQSQSQSQSLLAPPPNPYLQYQQDEQQNSQIAPNFTERAVQYRDKVEENIEKILVSIVKQVVNGDKPYLIQTKVETKPSPNLPKAVPLFFNEMDFTQTESFLESGGWSWRPKNSKKQHLPKLPEGLMYIRFDHKPQQKKFALLLHLMAKIYGMVIKNGSCTIRDIYYEKVALYGSQARLESAIYDLCHVLKVPRDGLRIEATSKGLMAGSLRFKTKSGDVINLSHFKTGMIIPSLSSVDDMYDIQSDAKQIIVVEKDAVFQRLIDERVFEEIGCTILITGKGYPDLVTLKMIRKLRDALNLKVFAFVDCDAYGIEIASIIRWGSTKQASIANCANDWSIAEELTVPDLVWLGLLPSEIADLSLKYRASSVMSVRDKYKTHLVKQKIMANLDAVWMEEVNILQNSEHKAELEALFIHPKFANFYLLQKLNAYFKIIRPPDSIPT